MSPSIDYGSPAFRLECDCGWVGRETDVDDWAVEDERDRVVRRCPGCGEPVPEWGAYRPVSGLVPLAKGPLREALADAGVLDGVEG